MVSRSNVTLTQLRYFMESAEQLSMTKAAQRLLVAQSAVSTAISQLETQIGAQLFVRRRSKGLLLTVAGKQLLRDSRNLMTGLDEALDAARGYGGDVRGPIRIACFVTLAPFILPDLLAQLGSDHPELEVDVVEVDASTAAEVLRDGSVELAITYNFDSSDDIDREVIGMSTPYVVLPQGHKLAKRAGVKLRELAGEPMVLLDLPQSRDYFLRMLASAGVSPAIRYRSTSYETVRTLVARGHGFSILNQRPASTGTYDGSAVVEVDISEGAEPLAVVLASLMSVHATGRARAVAAGVRRQFASR